jgi:hypothetical protein
VNVEPRLVPPARKQQLIESESSTHSSFRAERGPGWGIWLLRIRALLFVTVCATFGVLLIILPWTPKWTDNPMLLMHPGVRDLVASGFARGLASGLGVLDLWLGFWEAIHYHENPESGGS